MTAGPISTRRRLSRCWPACRVSMDVWRVVRPVVVFNGPQGGYHVDACFVAEGVPQEVFLSKLRFVESGDQIAGADETSDRVGVGLIEWSDKTCEGYYTEARGLIDDLWAMAIAG